MSLFSKAENTSAYLKMGFMGKPGSGKTVTASLVTIGLVQMMRQRGLAAGGRPVYFLDTEGGSDWVAPRFAEAGIPLFTAKTKAFSDLLIAMPEAETNASLLLVDSLTHFWVELCDAYMKAKTDRFGKPRTKLQFEDWAYLKAQWRLFTDAYVNSNLHCIVAGRAGYEYDYVVDDETGKKNLEKTDIKMKAESDMGYEPSMLVLMEREIDMATRTNRHVATVLKDRAGLIDGKEFVNPTFTSFLPHIERLNWGGRQQTVDLGRNSVASIPADIRDNRATRRKIVLAEIEDMMVYHYPGQSAAEKKRKIELCRNHFEATWQEMDTVMPIDRLRQGFDRLSIELEGKPSRYHVTVAVPIPVTMADVDSFPDHSAAPTVTHAAIMTAAQDPLNQENHDGSYTRIPPNMLHRHSDGVGDNHYTIDEHRPKTQQYDRQDNREEVMPIATIQPGTVAASPPPPPSRPAGASATDTDPLDIPPMLDRRKPSTKPKNLKDRLLADIPRLGTAQDVLLWSMTMSGVSDMLSKEQRDEVAAAVLARQTQLLNGAAAH